MKHYKINKSCTYIYKQLQLQARYDCYSKGALDPVTGGKEDACLDEGRLKVEPSLGFIKNGRFFLLFCSGAGGFPLGDPG